MNKNFSVATFDEYVNVSGHYGYVRGTAKEISKILGRCERVDNGQTCREWDRKVNGIVFTLYDYDECYYSASAIVEYHIGTYSAEDTEIVVDILRNLGLNAFIRKSCW